MRQHSAVKAAIFLLMDGTTQGATLKTFKITQKEAATFGATGFVGVVSFEPIWTRRGRRDVRGIRTDAKPTLDEAIRAVESIVAESEHYHVRGRPAIVADTQVYEIDSLGRDIDSPEYPEKELFNR